MPLSDLRLCERGVHEDAKASVHLTLAVLLCIVGAYNLVRWLRDGEAENGLNAALYGAGVVYEATRVLRHLG